MPPGIRSQGLTAWRTLGIDPWEVRESHASTCRIFRTSSSRQRCSAVHGSGHCQPSFAPGRPREKRPLCVVLSPCQALEQLSSRTGRASSLIPFWQRESHKTVTSRSRIRFVQQGVLPALRVVLGSLIALADLTRTDECSPCPAIFSFNWNLSLPHRATRRGYRVVLRVLGTWPTKRTEERKALRDSVLQAAVENYKAEREHVRLMTDRFSDREYGLWPLSAYLLSMSQIVPLIGRELSTGEAARGLNVSRRLSRRYDRIGALTGEQPYPAEHRLLTRLIRRRTIEASRWV
jgi:hypothetical protein